MDVNEVAKKSLKLKEDIHNLLITFQKETDCAVDSLSIDHIKNMDSEKPIGYVVHTKVVL